MIPGSRITLRALENRDVEQMRIWRNHPELYHFHFSHWPVSERAQQQWYENSAKDTRTVLFIIENEDGKSIGYTLIKDIDHKNRCAEIGLHLDPMSQGQGYGKDAFQTLMRFCFQELNIHRLYLQVLAFNQRAVALYEKLGFKTEGTLRESFFTKNSYQDILVMSILESEFKDPA